MSIQKILFTLLFCSTFTTLMAQSTKEKVVIKTSAVCGMCKTNIENAVNEIEGVKSVFLDVETKEAIVKYDGTVTSVAQIRQVIAAQGYQADEVPADEKAYQLLDACCQKDSGH